MRRRPVPSRRFAVRTEKGDEPLLKAADPESALSVVLTRASSLDGEPGTWEVVEYEDVIFRVVRHDNPEKKLDVTVEVIH